MRALLLTAVSVLILGAQAQAEEIIHSVEIKKVATHDFLTAEPFGWESDCTVLNQTGFGTNATLKDGVNLFKSRQYHSTSMEGHQGQRANLGG